MYSQPLLAIFCPADALPGLLVLEEFPVDGFVVVPVFPVVGVAVPVFPVDGVVVLTFPVDGVVVFPYSPLTVLYFLRMALSCLYWLLPPPD